MVAVTFRLDSRAVMSGEPMTEPIRVQVVAVWSHTEVRVWGEIDMLTAPRLRAEIDAAIEDGPRLIIVDLTHVSFIDSSGLHVLIAACQRLGPRAFAVVTLRDNIRRVFAISGVDNMIPIFESINAAVAGLNTEPTAE
jgi:anti-sigma B factor antagonist